MIDTQVRALFEEVLDDEPEALPPVDEDVARGRRLRRRRRHQLAATALAATVAAAVAVTALPDLGLRSPDAGSTLAPAADTVARTGEPPRILLGDPSWTVTHSFEVRPESGEVQLTRAGDTAQINWYLPDDPATTILADRRAAGHDEETVTVLGHEGRLFHYGDRDYEVIWQHGNYEIYLRAHVDSRDDVDALIGGLRLVDDDTWLAAMPDDYVRAVDNSRAVAEISADTPVPDSFSDLVEDRLYYVDPTDEHALTVETLHWVACSWVREWVQAEWQDEPISIDDELAEVIERADDEDAITEESVWTYARAIVDGETVIDGTLMAHSAPDDLRCGGW